MAAVLKTVDVKAFGGSNPSLSAMTTDFRLVTKVVHDFAHKIAPFLGHFLFPDVSPDLAISCKACKFLEDDFIL